MGSHQDRLAASLRPAARWGRPERLVRCGAGRL